MDVSSFTGRVISRLNLSTRIHPITGWPSLLPSSHPIPPTACLTVSLPEGEGMGLPRSTYLTANTLGPLFLPVGILSVPDVLQSLRTTHLPFGSSLTAPLACQYSRQLRVFTYVDHSILSLPLTRTELPGAFPPHGFHTVCVNRLRRIVRKASYPSRMHLERMLP